MLPTKTTLVSCTGFLKAWVDANEVTVYRSPLVQDDSEMYSPVRAVLDSRLYQVVSSIVIEDEEMMFGEGIFSVYKFSD